MPVADTRRLRDLLFCVAVPGMDEQPGVPHLADHGLDRDSVDGLHEGCEGVAVHARFRCRADGRDVREHSGRIAVGERSGGQLRETDQEPVRRRGVDEGRGIGDGRMAAQSRLHLAQLDAMPSDLDLVVLSAEELDRSIRPVPGDVSRPIQALPVRRTMDEPLVRLARVSDVSAREAGAADEELTGDPVRAVLEAAVEDSEVLIRQWRAVRDGWPLRIHLLDGVVDGPDGGFCRSAEAHDPGVGMAPPYAVGQIERNPVAGEEDEAQGERTRAPGILLRIQIVLHHLHLRWDGVPERHPVGAHQIRPVGGVVPTLRIWQHDDDDR